ncbi:MAG: hypothetical protein R3B13_19180 [Polyangiaceae bacterium]
MAALVVVFGFASAFPGAVLLLVFAPRDPVVVMILCAGLWVVVGFPLAYKLTLWQARRVGPGTPALRVYADRIELDRSGTAAWVFPRHALQVDASWFEGIAGEQIFRGAGNVSYGRGYTAVIHARLAAGPHAVVLLADGDIRVVYTSSIPRAPELVSRWPGEPRVRLWPAHLVALVTLLSRPD